MDDFFEPVVQRSSFTSAVTFMEQELRKVDRGRLFLYKQRDRLVARQLQFGIISEVSAGNIPKVYEISELESQLLRTKLVINGEALMYSFTTDTMVVLDNKRNRFCASAAIITFPEYETLVLIGFQPSELPFQYQQVMDALRLSMKRNFILETPELDLDYVAPVPRPHLIHNFDDSAPNKEGVPEWGVSVDGVFLRGLQRPVGFSPTEQRFGLLVLLNPLYPTFEYSLYLCGMIQETFPWISVAVCIKGATPSNHTKVCAKSPYYRELNSVRETALFADNRLQRSGQFYSLIDFFPPVKKPTFKKTLLQKTQEPYELLRDLWESNSPQYNQICQEQPTKLLEGADLSEIIQTLQLAFDAEVPKRQFWAEEKQVFLFGIPNPARRYAEPDKKYSAVLFSREIQCEKDIKLLAEHANVYLLMPGVWQATLKNAEQQNRQLHNCTVIFDVNNLFRIADDIFSTDGNHVFLFDEDYFQVASEFDLSKIEQIIQEHEKIRAQVAQQGLIQRQEEDADNDLFTSPQSSKPILGELMELNQAPRRQPTSGLALSGLGEPQDSADAHGIDSVLDVGNSPQKISPTAQQNKGDTLGTTAGTANSPGKNPLGPVENIGQGPKDTNTAQNALQEPGFEGDDAAHQGGVEDDFDTTINPIEK